MFERTKERLLVWLCRLNGRKFHMSIQSRGRRHIREAWRVDDQWILVKHPSKQGLRRRTSHTIRSRAEADRGSNSRSA